MPGQGGAFPLLGIQLKDTTVNVDELVPEMAAGVFRIAATLRGRGIPLVITSGNDSTHKAHSERHPRSLHYENRAIDFRLPSRFTGDQGTDAAMKLALAGRLGSAFDVVLEGDHFHVEYDPKS